MIHSLLMFLAPESAALNPLVQATLQQPPASSSRGNRATAKRVQSLKFVADVAGNAIGFGGILLACWLSLHILQFLL